MPRLIIKIDEFLETYVRPIAEKLGQADDNPLTPDPYSVFRAAIVAAAGGPEITVSFDIPDPFPTPGGGGASDPVPPPIPLPGLKPIDPVAVLKAVATAVRDAETILNQSNLALGNASAEITVVVDVGGIAGANATLTLNLGPTPRG